MRSLISSLSESGVIDGLMLWITVAIILVVMLPVLVGVISSSPTITAIPTDVGNLSGGGVLGSAQMNATQISLKTMINSSYGLLIVVLIVIAAVVILGVVAYLRTGKGK